MALTTSLSMLDLFLWDYRGIDLVFLDVMLSISAI
jgi:hypothetical protein